MADDEMIFDATLKKKKKKKTGFNLDTLDQPEPTPIVEQRVENPSEPVAAAAAAAEGDDMEMFGKKKKKKSKAFNLDELKENVPEDDNGLGGDEAGAGVVMDDMEMDFTKMKKKSNKKGKASSGLNDLLADDKKATVNGRDNEGTESFVSHDNEYSYEELLQRAFTLLKEKNPDMVTGEKRKFVMKPPQVLRIGSKKTAFANFTDICRLMHRIPKHLLQFLLAELGTSGSIDGNNQLIIKGKFQQKQIENVLKRYIKEYVTCHTCRSPSTILQKDARLYFLQCEQCNSRCSVAPIRSGFQAVANKQQRQAIRANQN